jgi:hypothetical protein
LSESERGAGQLMAQAVSGAGTSADTRPGARRRQTTTEILGFWAAVLTAACTVSFLILNLPVPSQTWHGMDAYIRYFDQTQMLWTIPTLLLAPIFVVLMACIHAGAPVDKKLLAQLGLIFAAIYATFESTNYGIQLLVVRPAILSGQGQDLAILSMANPNGVFPALELLGYVFQLAGVLFVVFVFGGGRLEQSIRWSLIGLDFGAVPLAAGLALLVPPLRTLGFASISTDLWAVFLALAGILLAAYFRRQGRITEAS